jgi:homogentisate 1,2-dioxygenase
MRYHSLGRVPAKRHVQFRDTDASANGQAPLLVEEVMGFEGFSGKESILYHLW